MPSKLYLKCFECGEVFDDITAAHGHLSECGDDTTWESTFSIVTEEEAF